MKKHVVILIFSLLLSIFINVFCDYNYITVSSDIYMVVNIVVLALPIIFLIIYFLIWIKYGKDDKVVETIEFYPPKGLNSAEVCLLYKGYVRNQDIVSLLVYLADKKYVNIVKTRNNMFKINLITTILFIIFLIPLSSIFGIPQGVTAIIGVFWSITWIPSVVKTRKGFTITKENIYKGNNEAEQKFLNGLFDKANAVTKEDLENSFYVTVDDIKEDLNSYENKKNIFEESSLHKSLYFWGFAMISIIFLLIAIRPILDNNSELSSAIILFPILVTLLIFLDKLRISKVLLIPIGMYWCIMWAYQLLQSLPFSSIYLVTYIIGLACILIIRILMRFMPKRTPYGIDALGKIRGFKNFLKIVEKEKLEELVESDPQYFYNILPYVYVLGVSNKWIKEFESITLQ